MQLLHRRRARKRIKLRPRIRSRQLHRGRIRPHPTHRQRSQEVQHIKHINVPLSPEEPAEYTSYPTILGTGFSSRRVEAQLRGRGIFESLVPEMQHGGERVCEIEDTCCGDDAGEAGEEGNGGADHVRDGPVDGDDGDPEESAAADGERGSFEEFDEDVVVEDC